MNDATRCGCQLEPGSVRRLRRPAARSPGRWTAVTIDSGDDAKSALDRITIPQDVLDRIAPTALPRSSITISDEPLNRETNDRTEFVVVLNNQPQGGLAMRRQAEVSIARRERGGPYYDPRQTGQYYPWQNGQYYYQRQQGWWWRRGAAGSDTRGEGCMQSTQTKAVSRQSGKLSR
jgi:hypothetical protein